MKTKLFVLLLAVLFADCKAQSRDEQAINMLNEFYRAYFSLCETSFSANDRQALLHRYCTKNCLRELEAADLDYDPFVDAQDCNAAWLRSLSVGKVHGQANIFEVSYTAPYSGKIVIRLALSEERTGFKINSIRL
ncbi:MAG: YbjP/YqhG family protein [Tannerellaceae bacterium]|jgi:hypothetical protein|nr:YbjP/YqhG family protein [Tannerellaceae bacterium]